MRAAGAALSSAAVKCSQQAVALFDVRRRRSTSWACRLPGFLGGCRWSCVASMAGKRRFDQR